MAALLMSILDGHRNIAGYSIYSMLKSEHVTRRSSNDNGMSSVSCIEHTEGCSALAGVDICMCGAAWSSTAE